MSEETQHHHQHCTGQRNSTTPVEPDIQKYTRTTGGCFMSAHEPQVPLKCTQRSQHALMFVRIMSAMCFFNIPQTFSEYTQDKKEVNTKITQ